MPVLVSRLNLIGLIILLTACAQKAEPSNAESPIYEIGDLTQVHKLSQGCVSSLKHPVEADPPSTLVAITDEDCAKRHFAKIEGELSVDEAEKWTGQIRKFLSCANDSSCKLIKGEKHSRPKNHLFISRNIHFAKIGPNNMMFWYSYDRDFAQAFIIKSDDTFQFDGDAYDLNL